MIDIDEDLKKQEDKYLTERKSWMKLNTIKVSKNDEWKTPFDLFQKLHKEFNFTIDVCAKDESMTMLPRYFSPVENGLLQCWKNEICWMNPPYSEVGQWIQKAYEESLNGAVIVALTYSKTDTKWFHKYCLKNEIRFLPGRLSFNNYGKAPCGSMITIFKPYLTGNTFMRYEVK